MKWLKLKTEVADTITRVPGGLVPPGHTLPPYDDAREFLVYKDIDGYTYIVCGLFTLLNKCRDKRLFTDDVWQGIEDAFVLFAEQNGFDIVAEVPEQGEL